MEVLPRVVWGVRSQVHCHSSSFLIHSPVNILWCCFRCFICPQCPRPSTPITSLLSGFLTFHTSQFFTIPEWFSQFKVKQFPLFWGYMEKQSPASGKGFFFWFFFCALRILLLIESPWLTPSTENSVWCDGAFGRASQFEQTFLSEVWWLWTVWCIYRKCIGYIASKMRLRLWLARNRLKNRVLCDALCWIWSIRIPAHLGIFWNFSWV